MAYGGLYDAANSQTLSTTLAALEGTAWDGSYGPTAYKTTLTATSNDGITPQEAGVYRIDFDADWHAGAAHTVTFQVYQGATAITGMVAAPMSVTETASQYQHVHVGGYASLTAGSEVRVFVKSASGTPTLTLANVTFTIRKVSAAA